MQNKIIKTCLTALAVSVAGLANAQQATAIEDAMGSYSAISGGAVSIGAQPKHSQPGTSNIGGHLASQAAVAIGAYTTVKDIYAGAAVTTGAWSRVEQIYAGGGVGIGANATALDIVAGAAVVVGASATVHNVAAGAAITVGAGAEIEGETYEAEEATDNANMMTAAIQAIHQKFVDNPVIIDEVETYTDLSELTINPKDDNSPHYFRAINLAASTTLTISGDVTVITSGAMTMGAGSQILLEEGANVTWILGGALTLGAGSTFNGKAYINGAVSGATSDVECGNLYATGAIGIRTIGDTCGPVEITKVCPLWNTEAKWLARQDQMDPHTFEIWNEEYWITDYDTNTWVGITSETIIVDYRVDSSSEYWIQKTQYIKPGTDTDKWWGTWAVTDNTLYPENFDTFAAACKADLEILNNPY
ncbi:hypothetical protein H4J46_01055 [Colwellia sp. MB02u-6]|uniref:hypothetical protein n=1 Tax=Colwellia sp. MB02u-6 TaxID=2759824 RepID=UPI0015F45B28|nr:hypothetical protein [Colwellia sp. MB02u-6]MBA6326554.1 hypothetical protein [Colwellia sp. MB02u-6]